MQPRAAPAARLNGRIGGVERVVERVTGAIGSFVGRGSHPGLDRLPPNQFVQTGTLRCGVDFSAQPLVSQIGQQLLF